MWLHTMGRFGMRCGLEFDPKRQSCAYLSTRAAIPLHACSYAGHVQVILADSRTAGNGTKYVTAEEAFAFERSPHADGRPQVEICMISSIDGAIAIDGVSGPLGGPPDKAAFTALRSAATSVLVGAGTVRAEHYHRPSRPDLTIAVVSHRGNLDTTSELFTSGCGVLVLPIDAPAVEVKNLRAGAGTVDLASALRQLGGSFVQVEGGAVLNAQLLTLGLVDAINLTLSPHIVGGATDHIVTQLPAPHDFRLTRVLRDDDFIFCRYEPIAR